MACPDASRGASSAASAVSAQNVAASHNQHWPRGASGGVRMSLTPTEQLGVWPRAATLRPPSQWLAPPPWISRCQRATPDWLGERGVSTSTGLGTLAHGLSLQHEDRPVHGRAIL